MPVTAIGRVLAGLMALWMGWRLWTGMQIGVIYGDGDEDVHAATHPTAYVLTALSCVLVIGILAYFAIGDVVLAWLR